MGTKQFKAESKRLLDLMINSIYTHKEIFLREIISNASDAIDKLYYKSLTDDTIKLVHGDFFIKINLDKEKRELTIIDNGCGMTEKELESNLGTIAKSGSLAFKTENEKKENIDIIGQFGVGFYSAFMVSDEVTVVSKAFGSDEAHCWKSKGVEGYTIEPCEKAEHGTIVILHLKEDSEDEKYSNYLDVNVIRSLVKKYSDYISYPIKTEVEHEHLKEGSKDEYETIKEIETLNSMIPLWKKNKSEVKQEEYDNFYMEKFYDFEKPLKTILSSVEGQCNYKSLLFIPSKAPYDYYSREYEKGLQLYSNGVLIMEKCADLLPDHFSFVKGLVDSQDLSLNISREMLQHDRQLKMIAKNIEKKIKSELEKMLSTNRAEYDKFFDAFGTQIKYGVYADYGINKDELKDLVLFYSANNEKKITFKEYIENMKDGQNEIYYACGETIDKINMLPQVETVKEKGYDILYLTENIDEFVVQALMQYENKKFMNVSDNTLDLSSEEEKEQIKKSNEENKAMFDIMKECIGNDIFGIQFTNKLKSHPVCLTSEGPVSVEMEKVLNSMPTGNTIKAKTILEINANHPITNKLKDLYNTDKEALKDYTKVLYAQARLIEGLTIDNPTELSNLICKIMTKE